MGSHNTAMLGGAGILHCLLALGYLSSISYGLAWKSARREHENMNFKNSFLDALEQDRFGLSETTDEKSINDTELTYSKSDEEMMVALPNIDKNEKEDKTVKNSKRTKNQITDFKKYS